MGHWVDISGYMVVNNAIPTHFSKLHNDEGMWTTEPFCMSAIAWLDSLLMSARAASGRKYPWAGLPTHIAYRHYNLDTDELSTIKIFDSSKPVYYTINGVFFKFIYNIPKK